MRTMIRSAVAKCGDEPVNRFAFHPQRLDRAGTRGEATFLVFNNANIQYCLGSSTAWTQDWRRGTLSPVRTLSHIKKLDDALGDFLVRITCPCGIHRTVDPASLARLCGRSATLESVGRRMRCSHCGTKGAEVIAVAVPRLADGSPPLEEALRGLAIA